MASGTSRVKNGAITGINVTPLVDITLVLLIVFMVTAKLIVSRQALSVELPRAASGNEVQEIFSVVLAAPGEASVNGSPLANDDEILPRARLAVRRKKELRGVINADSRVAHGRVMHVLDLLKQAGVSKIGFGVMPAPAASGAP